MSSNVVVFIVFLSILVFVVQGAIGMYVMGEKGKNRWLGFFIGGFGSLIGIIAITLIKQSDDVIVEEMYQRKLMNFKDYKDTKEFTLKK